MKEKDGNNVELERETERGKEKKTTKIMNGRIINDGQRFQYVVACLSFETSPCMGLWEN